MNKHRPLLSVLAKIGILASACAGASDAPSGSQPVQSGASASETSQPTATPVVAATTAAAMERDWDSMLDWAYDLYRPMIEAHPDRHMWGTDRVDIAWNYDTDLGKLLADFGRAFIGRFDAEIQEDLAYKNAERLIPGNSGS